LALRTLAARGNLKVLDLAVKALSKSSGALFRSRPIEHGHLAAAILIEPFDPPSPGIVLIRKNESWFGFHSAGQPGRCRV
jgi:hypothetical protein